MKAIIFAAFLAVSAIAVLSAPSAPVEPFAPDLAIIIEIIRVARDDISVAIDRAEADLAVALAGSSVLPQVLTVIRGAKPKALAAIEAGIVAALDTPADELADLFTRVISDLQTLYSTSIFVIQSFIAGESADTVTNAEVVFAHLALDIAEAMQPLVDALTPPELKYFRGPFDQGY